MAEIKFRCPQCTQKIAVAESAAGVKIDCPTCHSRLVIPSSAIAPVEVLIKRKLAIVDGSADAVYEELQKAGVQAEKATDEIKHLRAESEAWLTERKTLQSELDALRPLKDQLATAQQNLASAAAQQAEFTALCATHAENQERLSAISGQLGALQSERDSLAKTASEATELRGQLADALRDLASARSSAETMADAHRAQLDAAKGIESGVRAELAGAQTRHVQAEQRLTEQSAKLATIEAEHAALEELVGGLIPLREELTKAQTDLCNMCETAAEKYRGYESQLETSKTAETELKAKLGDLQARHAAAQKQIAEQTARLGEMEKRAAELQADGAAARTRGENLAGAQEELKRALEQAEQKAKERDDAARKSGEALSDAQAAEKTAREQADALNAKLADSERRHTAISHGFSSLKQERGDLTAELDALRKERDETAALLADKSKTLEKLIPAVESAKGELVRLREEANGAAVEKGRISAALEKASEDRAELLARCKQLEADTTAGGKEIERLKQSIASADASAKSEGSKLQNIAARMESQTALLAEKETALRDALATSEQLRKAHLTAQDLVQKAERNAAEAAERATKIESEKAVLAVELSRKSAELDAMKGEAAQATAALSQIKVQPKETQATAVAAPTDREKSLETERDALAAALERAKQHVGVLQARRDMLRDEVSTLRSRIGGGEKVTSGDEKPIAK